MVCCALSYVSLYIDIYQTDPLPKYVLGYGIDRKTKSAHLGESS